MFVDLFLVNAYRRRKLEGARLVVSRRMAANFCAFCGTRPHDCGADLAAASPYLSSRVRAEKYRELIQELYALTSYPESRTLEGACQVVFYIRK